MQSVHHSIDLSMIHSLTYSIYLYIFKYGIQIIVLENGRVIEQGPHEVLLTKGGRYAQLWAQQNSTVDAIDSAIKLEA